MDALVRPVVDPGFARRRRWRSCAGASRSGPRAGSCRGSTPTTSRCFWPDSLLRCRRTHFSSASRCSAPAWSTPSSTSCPRSRSASRTRPRPSPRYRATGSSWRGAAARRSGCPRSGAGGRARGPACDSDHVGHDPRLPRREEPPPAAFGRCGRFSCAYRVVEAGRDRRARRLPRERRARLCNPRCRPRRPLDAGGVLAPLSPGCSALRCLSTRWEGGACRHRPTPGSR